MTADPRLATDIGGVRFANPVWVGASELTMTVEGMVRCAAAGAGAVVAKSVNESEAARRQLAVADYAFVDDARRHVDTPRAAPDSALLNRSGLGRHDPDAWVEMLSVARPRMEQHGSVLVGSVVVGDLDAAPGVVRSIGAVTDHVELNVGAPHGREVRTGAVRQIGSAEQVEQVVRASRAVCPGLLLVKLGDIGPALPGAVAAARRAGADAVVLVGRSNGFLPDVDTLRPVLGSWGAWSAPSSLPSSLYAVSKAYRAAPGAPVVGTNGARGGDDVFRFLLSGAVACELVTSVWLEGPGAIGRTIGELSARLDRTGVAAVPDAVGVAVSHAREYDEIDPVPGAPEAWERWTR
ncbi:hypothetical protein WIS52_00730 [Pseudonocardia nematodicida]|uniref:Dihydroorotate dehydrogenase catalytic domain-containing protein n=1 Tax=Pseudonocardia nematodicida TaxID=1206997 RepID=A0ABV1K3E9_9PSEU